jgi:protein SCO1/2
MASSTKTLTIIGLTIAALIGSVLLISSLQVRNAEPLYALRLPDPMPLPEFELLDQDGNQLTNESFDDQWTLVFFGFTNCPDICPATLQVLSVARAQLASNNPDQELPDILLISVDPGRDTPESMKPYVAHFGDGVSGATGSLAELEKLTKTLGVYFAIEDPASPDAPENYNVAHSAHVALIDNRGRYHAVFSAPHTVDAFVTDVPILVGLDGR